VKIVIILLIITLHIYIVLTRIGNAQIWACSFHHTHARQILDNFLARPASIHPFADSNSHPPWWTTDLQSLDSLSNAGCKKASMKSSRHGCDMTCELNDFGHFSKNYDTIKLFTVLTYEYTKETFKILTYA